MTIAKTINKRSVVQRFDAKTDSIELPIEDIQQEAQQAFRFYLKIRGINIAYITEVERPSYTVSTQEYKLLNYFFKHPTEVKWNPISFTLVETFSRDAFKTIAGKVMNKLTEIGWDSPTNIDVANTNKVAKNFSKASLVDSLGPVSIQSLSSKGKVVEEWKLYGAFITEVKPSALNYSSDELTNLRIQLSYDWAELIYKPGL